ncbi:MAG: hypothetical protein A2V62_06845 [Nitrospirae bacterium RBG_19FT_COMBO_58_9]|nr:MAG: hypothetical protein A2V62_06845 [Nitrospirae bacterium RBG_19FT_COMBO_58_9]
MFKALRDWLPADYLVYYDVAVQGRYPDFIIVGPDLGVIVLEIKDWRLKSIAAVTAEAVVLREGSGEKTVKGPVRQVREYCLRIVDALKQRSLLYDGQNLRCGFGYGVVFPYLSSEDLERPSLFGPSLAGVLGGTTILSGEDLDRDRLLPALRRLIPSCVPDLDSLSSIQIDEIRGILHPEIRLGWSHSDTEILQVMDREQERLARAMGARHRMVRGVAGSGKTLILAARARHLSACHPDWRILVLCYNKVLADWLRTRFGEGSRIEVMHYHGWARQQLQRANVPVPPPPSSPLESDRYWDDTMPELLLKAMTSGSQGFDRYQAVLIDEGQDFADPWYRTVLRALDPATNSLFIALDSSQNIYKRKVSWQGVGIQIVGRTRILRVNYRNTKPILGSAFALIRELDAKPTSVLEAEEEHHVVPEQALRDGPEPEIHCLISAGDQRTHLVQWVLARLREDIPPNEILIMSLSRKDASSALGWLMKAGVAARLLWKSSEENGVRLSTIHSAKGLDAEAVYVLGAQDLDRLESKEARRLLYIAMTRARTTLCLSGTASCRLLKALQGFREIPGLERRAS